MFKRIMALVLSLVLMVSIFPMAASAATEGDAIVNQISRLYRKTLAASGEESLLGWCGFMTGYQLYYLGIDTIPHTWNGKDEYNNYCSKEVSSGGFRIKAYSAENYSLREALYTVSNGGTSNVYNILVGFQWTNTEAGQEFGHALFLHAIIDGNVYYAESSRTPMGAEGQPIVCSIDRFVDYYDSWTQFEGIIVFGQNEYADFCESFSTDLFVTTEADTPLLTQPAGEGSDSTLLRTVPAGERLHVSEVLKTPEGLYFYRISDSSGTGYMLPDTTTILQVNTNNVRLSNADMPTHLETGKKFSPQGYVITGGSAIGAIHAQILNAEGETVLSYEQECGSKLFSLSNKTLKNAMDFSQLQEGVYTYQIQADLVNQYVADSQLKTRVDSMLVHNAQFQVGGEAEESADAVPVEARLAATGWVLENNAWYYYENGEPRTGWFCDNGISYYLNEDGSVATGWVNINGRDRFFSDTGAMRTGWIQTENGPTYLLSNGVAAPEGWRTIDGSLYYIQEDGSAKTDCWMERDGAKYYLLSDGHAATGWLSLSEGNFCFRQDGRLMAQSIEEDGKEVILVYRESTGTMHR